VPNMPNVEEVRLVGDSYSADPRDLARLRELSRKLKKSKAELIRGAITDLLQKHDLADLEEGS